MNTIYINSLNSILVYTNLPLNCDAKLQTEHIAIRSQVSLTQLIVPT